MTSRTAALGESVKTALGDRVVSVAEALGELTLVVKAADLLEVMTMLRDNSGLRFEQLIDLCGVDYQTYGDGTSAGSEHDVGLRDTSIRESGPAPSGTDAASATEDTSNRAPSPGGARGHARLAVVYHLLSLAHNRRLRVRVFATEDEVPVLDSVIGVWPSANWFEREAFDLFGIVFAGHPDLRRILTDYGFIGHPFRKDFPISGNVEMRYDPDQQRVIYQPVTIEPREIVPRIVREENYADSESSAKRS